MEQKKVQKPWGSFTDFYHSDDKHVKIIEVNDNARLSMQSHKHRDEFWYVIEGTILATVIPNQEYMGIANFYVLEEGETLDIKAGEIHRMQAINGDAKVMEVATGKFKETDIKRYSDDYDREGTKKI